MVSGKFRSSVSVSQRPPLVRTLDPEWALPFLYLSHSLFLSFSLLCHLSSLSALSSSSFSSPSSLYSPPSPCSSPSPFYLVNFISLIQSSAFLSLYLNSQDPSPTFSLASSAVLPFFFLIPFSPTCSFSLYTLFSHFLLLSFFNSHFSPSHLPSPSPSLSFRLPSLLLQGTSFSFMLLTPLVFFRVFSQIYPPFYSPPSLCPKHSRGLTLIQLDPTKSFWSQSPCLFLLLLLPFPLCLIPFYPISPQAFPLQPSTALQSHFRPSAFALSSFLIHFARFHRLFLPFPYAIRTSLLPHASSPFPSSHVRSPPASPVTRHSRVKRSAGSSLVSPCPARASQGDLALDARSKEQRYGNRERARRAVVSQAVKLWQMRLKTMHKTKWAGLRRSGQGGSSCDRESKAGGEVGVVVGVRNKGRGREPQGGMTWYSWRVAVHLRRSGRRRRRGNLTPRRSRTTRFLLSKLTMKVTS
ncbi:hypothetical protein C7M84_023978 [Penaeus vannamei]|uniref:Uncharacterized protein n=1 Tax=Penaeus vannamei TaxID=6689 RepID=A0A423U2C3_PENVA|nr:hypothetical protein C7M84_023978 [Penaeus vannamei]